MISFKTVQRKELSSAPEVMNQTFLEIIQRKERKPYCPDTQEKTLPRGTEELSIILGAKSAFLMNPSSFRFVVRHWQRSIYVI